MQTYSRDREAIVRKINFWMLGMFYLFEQAQDHRIGLAETNVLLRLPCRLQLQLFRNRRPYIQAEAFLIIFFGS